MDPSRSRAEKHGISRERSGYVAQTAPVMFRQPAPAGSPLDVDRLVFLGPDETGVLLEVMGVETEHNLLVIHAMKMRTKYTRYLTGENDG